MQMQCSQRPQELWKDLCKYLMHSCALRFMEIKTTVTKPMPHLLPSPYPLPFLPYNKFVEDFMRSQEHGSSLFYYQEGTNRSTALICIRLNRIQGKEEAGLFVLGESFSVVMTGKIYATHMLPKLFKIVLYLYFARPE